MTGKTWGHYSRYNWLTGTFKNSDFATIPFCSQKILARISTHMLYSCFCSHPLLLELLIIKGALP